MKFTRNLSVADYHDLVKRMLRVFEGEFLRPYVDPVGIITIGIGITVTPHSTLNPKLSHP
jgi:GH24 family phage-related lysozyme (muramidase)